MKHSSVLRFLAGVFWVISWAELASGQVNFYEGKTVTILMGRKAAALPSLRRSRHSIWANTSPASPP